MAGLLQTDQVIGSGQFLCSAIELAACAKWPLQSCEKVLVSCHVKAAEAAEQLQPMVQGWNRSGAVSELRHVASCWLRRSIA